MARSAPAPAQRSAMARPMPLDAPVTKTFLRSSTPPPPLRLRPVITSQIPTYQCLSILQGAVMELLVSVRSAKEVEAALAGGADIIDAKEPSRGSLGAVSPKVL